MRHCHKLFNTKRTQSTFSMCTDGPWPDLSIFSPTLQQGLGTTRTCHLFIKGFTRFIRTNQIHMNPRNYTETRTQAKGFILYNNCVMGDMPWNRNMLDCARMWGKSYVSNPVTVWMKCNWHFFNPRQAGIMFKHLTPIAKTFPTRQYLL